MCPRALREGRAGGGQDRIVLDAIGSRIAVAGVVGCYARVEADQEFDPEAVRRPGRLVGIDAVAADADLLPAGVDDAALSEGRSVESDCVALAGRRSADRHVRSPGRDAGPEVAEIDRPGHIGADEVSVHDVAGAGDLEAVIEAGSSDDIAFARPGAADYVIGSGDAEAALAESEEHCSGRVRPDEIALERVARPVDAEPVAAAGDDVVAREMARTVEVHRERRRPAGGRQQGVARRGQADEVARDRVAAAQEVDPGLTAPDQVARGGRGASDDDVRSARHLDLLGEALVRARDAVGRDPEEVALDSNVRGSVADVDARGIAEVAVGDGQAPDRRVARLNLHATAAGKEKPSALISIFRTVFKPCPTGGCSRMRRAACSRRSSRASVIAGSRSDRRSCATPEPAMLNAIVSAPGLALASRIAWRSEPAPASAVDVTVYVAARAATDGQPGGDRGAEALHTFLPPSRIRNRSWKLEGIVEKHGHLSRRTAWRRAVVARRRSLR